MNFMLRDGWSVHFIEEDCKTPAGRRFTLKTLDELRAFAKRGSCEDLDELERCVRHWGQGSVWLRLTDEQYRKLSQAWQPVSP